MKTDPRYLRDAPPPIPGENDEEAVRRIFRGDVFSCRACGASIEWPGVCDACADAMCRAVTPPSVDEVLLDRGVPRAMIHASFETFDTAILPNHTMILFGHVRRWRPSRGPAFLLIEGPPGVGKTHLAVATLRRYVADTRRLGCRFVVVPELLEKLRTGYGANETENAVEALSRVELLALDDLGAARLTEWSVDVQSSILTARHNAGLGTVITTNMSLSEISNRIDPRVASRLGEAMNIRLDLSDYRGRRQ